SPGARKLRRMTRTCLRKSVLRVTNSGLARVLSVFGSSGRIAPISFLTDAGVYECLRAVVGKTERRQRQSSASTAASMAISSEPMCTSTLSKVSPNASASGSFGRCTTQIIQGQTHGAKGALIALTGGEWVGEALEHCQPQVLCGACYDLAKQFHMG